MSASRAHGPDDWSASTVIKHCDERSSVGTRGSFENSGTVGVETAPRGHESRKARAVRTWQRLWRLGFHIQRIRGYTRSCLSCLAENSETIANSGDGDFTTRTAVCKFAVLPYGAHRREHNGFEAYCQLCLMYGTSVQEGSTGLFVQIMTYKFGSKILKTWKTVWSKFWSWWDHTVRWTVQIPFSVECWWSGKVQRITRGDWRLFEEQTHHQHDFSQKRTTKIQWKSMQSPGKGKAKKNPARARMARKEKKATQAKVTEKQQQNTQDSMVNVETVESMDTKDPIVGTSRRTNLKVKSRARDSRNPRWQKPVSDSSKQVDDWNESSNTSAQQPNSSQVNTIGCADEELWIFSLQDNKKRRYSVNWEDQSRSILTEKWKTEEHQLMIDSGRFGHVCPPWFAPQFPMVSSTDVAAVAANNVALQHTTDKKWCTGTWWRTVENESWCRSHLTWWRCANHSWALLNWNFVVSQSFSITIMTASFFETRQWIFYLMIVIPSCTSFWRMEFLLAKRLWWLERMRQMSWMKKSTTTSEPREVRLEKLQLVIDEQWPMRIRLDSLAKTARSIRTLEPPTDAARLAHNAAHVSFRDWSPMCVASCGRSSPHRRVVVNKTADTLPKFQTDYLFIRTVAESKTQRWITFVETRSGVVISFMCARKGGYEDLTKEIWRHFWSLWFPQSSDHSLR